MARPDGELQTKPGAAVGKIFEVANARNVAFFVEVFEFGDHSFGAHHVREFGNHDGLATSTQRFDMGLGADTHRPSTGLVGGAEILVNDDAATRKIWPRKYR